MHLRIDRYDLLYYLTVGCCIFIIGYAAACIRKQSRPPLLTVRNAALLVFCCYGAALLSLTGMLSILLEPAGIRMRNPLTGFVLTPFRGHVFRPILQNFLLFLPLGFLLPSVTPKLQWNLLKMLLTGFAVSLCIELLQGLIGRMQEADDLIVNTAGCGAGYMLWAVIFRRDYSIPGRLLRFFILCAVCIGGLWGIRQLCAM